MEQEAETLLETGVFSPCSGGWFEGQLSYRDILLSLPPSFHFQLF